MLVLSRKVGEFLRIGPDIVVCINRVSGNRVTVGIEAPDHIRVVRGELPPERESHGPPMPPDDTAPVEVRKTAAA